MQGREVVYEKGCVVAFEDWWVYPPSFDPPTGWTLNGYIQPSASTNNYECQITTRLRLYCRSYLQVDIAQRATAKGVEHIANLHSLSVDSQDQGLVDGGVAGWRLVRQGQSTGHLIRLTWVKRLPNPVDAVKHSVVEPKDGVVHRGVEISSVATHGVVT